MNMSNRYKYYPMIFCLIGCLIGIEVIAMKTVNQVWEAETVSLISERSEELDVRIDQLEMQRLEIRCAQLWCLIEERIAREVSRLAGNRVDHGHGRYVRLNLRRHE
jgi:hypothetical protein